MKLLLDESLPGQLAGHFPGHFEISTVQRMGWAGSKTAILCDWQPPTVSMRLSPPTKALSTSRTWTDCRYPS